MNIARSRTSRIQPRRCVAKPGKTGWISRRRPARSACHCCQGAGPNSPCRSSTGSPAPASRIVSGAPPASTTRSVQPVMVLSFLLGRRLGRRTACASPTPRSRGPPHGRGATVLATQTRLGSSYGWAIRAGRPAAHLSSGRRPGPASDCSFTYAAATGSSRWWSGTKSCHRSPDR